MINGINLMRLKYLLIILALFLFLPFCAIAASDSAESAWKPWSGYWWPSRHGGLGTGIDYKGQPAPLQKYDMYASGTYNGAATGEYLLNNYLPDSLSWVGLCGAYAAAAVTENNDFVPGVADNIVFRTGDKKGLVTIAHDLDWIVGIRQNNETPDIFHYWLLNYIKEQGKAFFAELDPSPEVWNYPVYKYSMTTEDISGGIKVKCTIWYADDLVSPDYLGTKEMSAYYEYTLFKTGDVITGGEWTGSSVYNHPQQLYMPLERATTMTKLDYDKVMSIVNSKDDALESALPVSISSGEYRLLLLNEDKYLVELDESEESRLCLEKNEGSQSVSLEISGSDGTIVYSGTLDQNICLNLSYSIAPYLVKLSQDDYFAFSVYTLKLDNLKKYEFANPKIQKAGTWGGVAIVNNNETPVTGICLSGYGKSGQPIQTYLGPFSLAPKEKKIILLSDLKVRNIDRDEFLGIKIDASKSLSVSYMSGSTSRNMSSFQYQHPSSKLIVPDTASWSSNVNNLSWGLYNPALINNDLKLNLYEKNGSLKESKDLSLDPKIMTHFYEGVTVPFTRSIDEGWISIEGSLPFSGYEQWINNGGIKTESLPLLIPARDFVLPHTVDSNFWKNSVVLINTSSASNQINCRLIAGHVIDNTSITLDPFEKRKIYIKDLFPQLTSDVISNSSLQMSSLEDIAGYFSYETDKDVMYFSLLDSSHKKNTLVLPHCAVTDDWWTGCMIYNPDSEPVNLQIKAYSIDGTPLNTSISQLIGGMAKFVFNVAELFGNDAGSIAYISISTDSGTGVYGLYGIGNLDDSKLSGGILE